MIFSKYGNWIPEQGFSLGTLAFSTSKVLRPCFAQNFAATGSDPQFFYDFVVYAHNRLAFVFMDSSTYRKNNAR